MLFCVPIGDGDHEPRAEAPRHLVDARGYGISVDSSDLNLGAGIDLWNY